MFFTNNKDLDKLSIKCVFVVIRNNKYFIEFGGFVAELNHIDPLWGKMVTSAGLLL